MIHESSTDEQEEEKLVAQNSPSLSSNDDLKELCLLLDEERKKMHELAEQWKQFGTSTIHKLECQIIDYQEKLNELDQRQVLLVEENHSLKSLIDQLILKPDKDGKSSKKSQQNASTQANLDKVAPSHHSCFHRPKSMHDELSRTNLQISRQMSVDDPLQQQISIQNMFDAIKTAEVYESIEEMNGDSDESEKKLLKQFCNLIWKYLEDRSKPKSSCLL